MRIILFFVLVFLSVPISKAQDSTALSLRRNTVKIDLTGNLIYRNALNLSYERVVKRNQSFVVTGGYQEFPKMVSFGENVEGKKEDSRNGYKFGGEYRFYLQKENKFAAQGEFILDLTLLPWDSNRTVKLSIPEQMFLKKPILIQSWVSSV